jgi:hypothetical protein
LVSAAAALTMDALARRRWLNLGLLALVGGLVVLALVEPGRQPPPTVSRILDLPPARIERIAVERPGQEPLAFARRGDRWQMKAPEIGPANPVLIEAILSLAELRCPQRYAVAEVELKRLRLDPPRLRLWLNAREIRFGDTDPTDARRYLHVGETVFLCADDLYPLLTSAAGSFLTPTIESLTPTHPSDE